jgi:diguanylate cyclase (GGDEF)-like protein/PAS domain S-box-containing protein
MTTPLLAFRHAPAWGRLPRVRVSLADAPSWAGLAVAAAGAIVVTGWAAGNDTIKSILPGLGAMKANTGLCFMLMGAGLVLLSRAAVGSRARTVGVALVCGAVLIALATAAEYLTGVDLGIDQRLFRDGAAQIGAGLPGRMSPLTAFSVMMLGAAALLASRVRPARSGRVPQIVIVLAGITLAASFVNVLDFLVNAAVPSFLAGYTLMAPGTAVVMAVLTVGVLALLGPASPFAVLAGKSTTALLLRRLLVVSVIAHVFMAWLRLEGQRLGLFDASYGTTLMLVGILTVSLYAILRSARWATQMEANREDMEIERDRFFELSLDVLSVVGSDGRFRRVNGAWESILGYRPSELVGRSSMDLVHPDDHDLTLAESNRHYEKGEPVEPFQNRYRHRDGSYRWLEWMSQTAPDRSVAFAVGRDVTDRKVEEDRRARQQRALKSRNEALSERVDRDPLTGLHNRRYFDAEVVRLERRWSGQSARERPPVSVIIFDLDHFGQVNKQHGHQAGDAVLRVFSTLLKNRFRESDLVARYGGEEFVAVLEGASAASAMRIAEDVRATFEAASVEIGTQGPIRVTVSAGFAELKQDRDALAGLSVADVWLSQAKRAGRNQVLGL